MEGKTGLIEKYSIYFLYIIFAVGIVGHSIEYTYDLMIALTPLTLFITSSVMIFNLALQKQKKYFIWFVIVFISTFVCEIVGVETGLIFGNYVYGETLDFKLFDVPIIIGINWTLVITGSIMISKFCNNQFLVFLIVPVLATLFDFVLEPVAIKLDYWSWKSGTIPLYNYVSWFIISLLAFGFYKFLKIELNSRIAKHYYFIQLVFFAVLLITV